MPENTAEADRPTNSSRHHKARPDYCEWPMCKTWCPCEQGPPTRLPSWCDSLYCSINGRCSCTPPREGR